jgi:hypothetical protein
MYPFTKVEEIQEKAILKAKKKGADAVLIFFSLLSAVKSIIFK